MMVLMSVFLAGFVVSLVILLVGKRSVLPLVAGYLAVGVIFFGAMFVYRPFAGWTVLSIYATMLGILIICMARGVSVLMITALAVVGVVVSFVMLPVTEGIRPYHVINLPDRFMAPGPVAAAILVFQLAVFGVTSAVCKQGWSLKLVADDKGT